MPSKRFTRPPSKFTSKDYVQEPNKCTRENGPHVLVQFEDDLAELCITDLDDIQSTKDEAVSWTGLQLKQRVVARWPGNNRSYYAVVKSFCAPDDSGQPSAVRKPEKKTKSNIIAPKTATSKSKSAEIKASRKADDDARRKQSIKKARETFLVKKLKRTQTPSSASAVEPGASAVESGASAVESGASAVPPTPSSHPPASSDPSLPSLVPTQHASSIPPVPSPFPTQHASSIPSVPSPFPTQPASSVPSLFPTLFPTQPASSTSLPTPTNPLSTASHFNHPAHSMYYPSWPHPTQPSTNSVPPSFSSLPNFAVPSSLPVPVTPSCASAYSSLPPASPPCSPNHTFPAHPTSYLSLLSGCVECSEKDAMITQLREDVETQRLRAEAAEAALAEKNEEERREDATETVHLRYIIVRNGVVPEEYTYIDRKVPVVIPETWFQSLVTRHEKKGTSFIIKKLIDGLVQEDASSTTTHFRRKHGQFLQALEAYATQKKMSHTEWCRLVSDKIASMQRSAKKRRQCDI